MWPWVSRHRLTAALALAAERGVRAATADARYHALVAKLVTPPVPVPDVPVPPPVVHSPEAAALKRLSDETTERMAEQIARDAGIPLDRARAEAADLCRNADRLMFGEMGL